MSSRQAAVALSPLLQDYVLQTRQEARRRQRIPPTIYLIMFSLGVIVTAAAPEYFLTCVILFLILGLLVTMGMALTDAGSGSDLIAPEWVRQGTLVLETLDQASKETLPELFTLGEALESLPKRRRRSRRRRDPNGRRADQLSFEIQEALFLTLTRLLTPRSPEELTELSHEQRAFLRRAIFRTADASFIACALLVLATLQDTELRTQAEELSAHHPSERIREAASEYLHALATSLSAT